MNYKIIDTVFYILRYLVIVECITAAHSHLIHLMHGGIGTSLVLVIKVINKADAPQKTPGLALRLSSTTTYWLNTDE